MDKSDKLYGICTQIAACSICAADLPLGPRPVVRATASSRMLVIGQAPGRKVHASGVPWDDASGIRLRQWMGVDADNFYDATRIAIVPMGFCYPGTGKSGDLPPRPECAPHWHGPLLAGMQKIELTLLIGQYAQAYYLQGRRKGTLTETVSAWREYAPAYLPLPHPSPRNNIWLKRNAFFEREIVPHLQERVRAVLP
jgi:uracil-DNA glycosylase